MSTKDPICCLTDIVRMAKIIRLIVSWSTLARHKDSPGQEPVSNLMHVFYVVFFNGHIHHGQC